MDNYAQKHEIYYCVLVKNVVILQVEKNGLFDSIFVISKEQKNESEGDKDRTRNQKLKY